MSEASQTSRREFLKAGLAAAAVVGGGISVAGSIFAQEKPAQTPPSPKPVAAKPPYRFSLDPFEVQKKGYIVYNYGTHGEKTPSAGIESWYDQKAYNFVGCHQYRVKDDKIISKDEDRKHWEGLNVVPVNNIGADPKAGVDAVRKGWESAAASGYRVLSVDEFYAVPQTPVEYDKALEEFKKAHPEIFLQVWEATVPAKFPHLEIFMPFIDAYMPEIYWKWFKNDADRRKLFRQLIDRAKKIGELKKLLIGLGTHDVPHLKKTLEDIPAILDMDPGIGGFAIFIHVPGSGEEYDKLYAKLDGLLRGLFAE